MQEKKRIILTSIIRISFIILIGFSLYLIYTNFNNFAIIDDGWNGRDLDTPPQNKTTIIVTSAE